MFFSLYSHCLLSLSPCLWDLNDMTLTEEDTSSKLDVHDVDRDFDAGFYDFVEELDFHWKSWMEDLPFTLVHKGFTFRLIFSNLELTHRPKIMFSKHVCLMIFQLSRSILQKRVFWVKEVPFWKVVRAFGYLTPTPTPTYILYQTYLIFAFLMDAIT